MSNTADSNAQSSGSDGASAERSPGFGSMVLLASIMVSFLAASSSPTPLYAIYACKWHFSPITTTIIFGVYAIAVLLALLTLGRVSDHTGRRPVLIGALALQLIATFVLITDTGIAALLLSRILQGISTGGALGALGAAMIDINRRRGTLASSAAPGFGSGTGALLSGVLVQYAPAPTHLVFAVLICIFVLQSIGVALMPESSNRKPWVRTALIPELALPVDLRPAALTAAPIIFAAWALAGFYGSLGPALARQLSGSTSVVIGGLGLFILAVVAAITTVVLERISPRAMMLFGIGMLLMGTAGALVSVSESSTIGYFVSTFVAGVGFGAGFQGGIRTVIPHAAAHERAGVLSTLYLICYLGMGVPSMIAGVLVVHGGGLTSTACGYILFVSALALAALVGLLTTNRSPRR